jgi:hypothetical protein
VGLTRSSRSSSSWHLQRRGCSLSTHGAAAWTWDLARIRAKGYTDNVVDLMARKLNRLPDLTQEAIGLLACLGNVAEITTPSLVQGESDAFRFATLGLDLVKKRGLERFRVRV